jgi:hypothetical protein
VLSKARHSRDRFDTDAPAPVGTASQALTGATELRDTNSYLRRTFSSFAIFLSILGSSRPIAVMTRTLWVVVASAFLWLQACSAGDVGSGAGMGGGGISAGAAGVAISTGTGSAGAGSGGSIPGQGSGTAGAAAGSGSDDANGSTR